MLRNVHTTVRNLIITGAASAALLSPVVATARPVADVGGQLPVSHVLIDLRSPDAATPIVSKPAQTDLRSPDAALPVHVTSVPAVSTPTPAGAHADSNDFDFGAAAIGAGIAVLVALACAGSMVAVRRRGPLSLGS
jgi:hypothetical protein